MVLYIKLGWRNIWRNKRRSMVVISSIGLGVFLMIITMSIVNGMNYQMIDNTISTSLGHVSIHKKGFSENLKPSYGFTVQADSLERIRKTDGVTAAAPRVKIQGVVRSSEAAQGVIITGIDPEQERAVSQLAEYILPDEGDGYPDDPDGDWIIISKQMAEKLDLLAGDRIVVMLQDRNNEIVGESFYVRAVYVSPIDSFDKFVVFTGIKKLQAFAAMGGSISEINIRTADRNMAVPVRERLKGIVSLPGIETVSWQEMAPSMMSALQLYDTMMFIFFAIIFITVIFSVANTMIMAIMERFHELGVMKCIGTRPLNIFIMITWEAVGLGFAGMLSGLAAGLLFVAVFSFTGLDLSLFSESMRIWGTGSVIYPLIMMKDIVSSVVIVFMTAVFASVYPALKAARIKPMEALNYI